MGAQQVTVSPVRVVLVASILAVSLTAPAAAYDPAVTPPGYRACSGTFGPDGERGGGFYREIKAKRVGCAEARRVVRGFLRSDAVTGPIRIRGFRCTQRSVRTDEDDPNGGALVVCTRGRRAVRAYGHP
jgi:hypothetical protein